jgi:hypothetical protein
MERTGKYIKYDTLPIAQPDTQSILVQDSGDLAKGSNPTFDKDYSASSKDYLAFSKENLAFSESDLAFSKDYSISNKDYPDSHKPDSNLNLALQTPRSGSSPVESDDGMYDYNDSPQLRIAERIRDTDHDSTSSPSDGEGSVGTNSTPESKDTETRFLYEGPLAVWKSRALDLILDAYKQFRCPITEEDNHDTDTKPNDRGTAENGLDRTRTDGSGGDQGSTSHRPKRKSCDHDEGDDGREKRKKPSKSKMPTALGSEQQLWLACPFYKRDFRKHRSCCLSAYHHIAHVKYVVFYFCVREA